MTSNIVECMLPKTAVLNEMIDLVQKGQLSASEVIKFEATGVISPKVEELLPDELKGGAPGVPPTYAGPHVMQSDIEVTKQTPLLIRVPGGEEYDVLEICRKVTAMEHAMCEDCRETYETVLESMAGMRELSKVDDGR